MEVRKGEVALSVHQSALNQVGLVPEGMLDEVGLDLVGVSPEDLSGERPGGPHRLADGCGNTNTSPEERVLNGRFLDGLERTSSRFLQHEVDDLLFL